MRIIKYLLLLIILIVGIYFVYKYSHFNKNIIINVLKENNLEILKYRENHLIKFLLYFTLIYIGVIVISFPGTIVLDIFAGYLFSIPIATILIIFCFTSGSLLNFLLIKYLFKNSLKNKFSKFHYFFANGHKYALLIRLTLFRFIAVIPYGMLNVLSVFFNISLKSFLLSVIIGVLPLAILYAYIGRNIYENSQEFFNFNFNFMLQPKLFLVSLILLVIIFLPMIINHFTARAKENTDKNFMI